MAPDGRNIAVVPARRGGPWAVALGIVGISVLVTGWGPSARSRAGGDEQKREAEADVERIFLRDGAVRHGNEGQGTRRGPTLVGVGAASAHHQLTTGLMPLAEPDDRVERGAPAYGPEVIAGLIRTVASFGDGPPVPEVSLDDADLGRGGDPYRLSCAACHHAAGSSDMARPFPHPPGRKRPNHGLCPCPRGKNPPMPNPSSRPADPRPVAVVTGASAGVGRATALALADAGYDVGLLARGRTGLDAAAREVEVSGATALALAVDVADPAAVDAAAGRVEEELGPIDLWVNNAMTSVFAPVHEVSAEEIRRATEVTYLGQVHGTLAALARMRPRDRGTIVGVGSALAYRAIPLQAAYCGAKFAVRGFMESVRTELLHEGSGVRVTMVHLPAIDTPQFGWCRSRLPAHPRPVPPIYEPERAARVIVAAARRPTRRRILGVWNRLIIQGNKLVPGVMDHYAARTGVASQQTTLPPATDRGNLTEPLDETCDAGPRGIFGARAGGMLDPAFLRDLPATAAQLGAAIVDRAREIRTR